ncbi:hypothetical protein [Haladaptatus litoreus]|uniref:hypothetical protein n=1 Tax=Haladaptatus litoreus TaxID=553468 RepID=UPI000971259A|nr:hypothetical protein [Haladaptatus litoreus]
MKSTNGKYNVYYSSLKPAAIGVYWQFSSRYRPTVTDSYFGVKIPLLPIFFHFNRQRIVNSTIGVGETAI